MNERQVERVRRACAAMPECEERLSHGEPTFFVRKRVFAMTSNDHHGDGHVAVVYTVTQWPAARALIGDERLKDPKFATRAGRRKHIAELYDIITPWFADKTRAEIQKTAQAKGVPFGPIFSPAELLENEQYVTRSFLAEMKHPVLGKLLMPQLPVQWNGRSFAPRPAPEIARSELAA